MSPPIYTPDGSEVSEIVLPDGSTASQVIGPDGNVVFEAGPDIPDIAIGRWPIAEGSDLLIYDSIASNNGTLSSGTWNSGTWVEGYALTDPRVDFDTTYTEIASDKAWSVSLTFQTATTSQSNTTIWQHRSGLGELFAVSLESGEIAVARYDGSDWVEFQSGSLSADTKTRIFWAYGSSGSRLWLNNTEVTGSTTPSGDANNTGMTLGYDAAGGREVSGDVDEPITYDAEGDASTADDDYNRQPWS